MCKRLVWTVAALSVFSMGKVYAQTGASMSQAEFQSFVVQKLGDMDKRLADMDKRLAVLESQVASLDRRITSVKTDLNARIHTTNTFVVAFFTILSVLFGGILVFVFSIARSVRTDNGLTAFKEEVEKRFRLLQEQIEHLSSPGPGSQKEAAASAT